MRTTWLANVDMTYLSPIRTRTRTRSLLAFLSDHPQSQCNEHRDNPKQPRSPLGEQLIVREFECPTNIQQASAFGCGTLRHAIKAGLLFRAELSGSFSDVQDD